MHGQEQCGEVARAHRFLLKGMVSETCKATPISKSRMEAQAQALSRARWEVSVRVTQPNHRPMKVLTTAPDIVVKKPCTTWLLRACMVCNDRRCS